MLPGGSPAPSPQFGCCPALSALLNERAALSSEMALRIEKAFGVSMDTLMRMQNSYDIAQARRRAGRSRLRGFTRLEIRARRSRDRMRMIRLGITVCIQQTRRACDHHEVKCTHRNS
jgi:hypothetical protein